MAPTVRELVVSILAQQADKSFEDVCPESTPASLGLDSLDVVEVSIRLEDEFHIEIPTKELQNWKNVRDIVNYMENKTKLL